MRIRNFTFKDYREFAKLWKYAYPASNISDAEFMFLDGDLDPKIVQERQVAEIDNKIIGVYELTHWKQFYHPHKYFLHLIVNPEQQRMGVGSALYTQMMTVLKSRNPLSLRAWALQENSEAIDFLKKRGFAEEMRTHNLVLDVQNYDFRPYTGLEESLSARNIEIKSFDELSDKMKYASQLHKIYCDSLKNMDLPDNPELPGLSEIESALQLNPEFYDNFIVAQKGEELVGICTLSPLGNEFYNEVTGVSSEYRNQGIATGLFIKAIRRTCANSFSHIRNDVLDRNISMMRVMKKLGFLQYHVEILFQKRFHDN